MISILQDLYDGLKKKQFGKGLILVPKIQYTYKTLITKMGINLAMLGLISLHFRKQICGNVLESYDTLLAHFPFHALTLITNPHYYNVLFYVIFFYYIFVKKDTQTR